MSSDPYPHYYERYHDWNGLRRITHYRVESATAVPEAFYPSNGLWYRSQVHYTEADLVKSEDFMTRSVRPEGLGVSLNGGTPHSSR
jgi:hypothetical protein